MKLAEAFRELYGLNLSLPAGGGVRVVATRRQDERAMREILDWLRRNREHVIRRLREEGTE